MFCLQKNYSEYWTNTYDGGFGDMSGYGVRQKYLIHRWMTKMSGGVFSWYRYNYWSSVTDEGWKIISHRPELLNIDR